MENKLTKIGVLGGAFNPPHKGHLLLAKKISKKFGLTRFFLIPTGVPTLEKPGLAGAKERLAMTKILVKNEPDFSVLDYEVKKKGGSYTSETIDYLKRKFKGAEIFWLIGEDSFREIIEGRWEKSSGIFDKAKFVVVSRPHHPYNLKNLPDKFKRKTEQALKKVEFVKFVVPFSATQIREKLEKGEKVENYLTKEIINYIKEKKLYG